MNNLNFELCENKERELMTKYLIPYLKQKYPDMIYKFSDIGTYDNKDMTAIINNKEVIFECKVRLNVKDNYLNGLILEKDKYKRIKNKYPKQKFYYVNFINDKMYIFDIDSILTDYTLNELQTYLKCPKTTAGYNNTMIEKLVIKLTPTSNKKYCRTINLC